jgi:hypothetical protein
MLQAFALMALKTSHTTKEYGACHQSDLVSSSHSTAWSTRFHQSLYGLIGLAQSELEMLICHVALIDMRVSAFVESAMHGTECNYAMLNRLMLVRCLENFPLPEWRIQESSQGRYGVGSEKLEAGPLLCSLQTQSWSQGHW